MKLSMIYMASGFGSRFGENKLLVPLFGKPLYLYGLDHLIRAAGLLMERGWEKPELIVVSQYREILEEAERRSLPGIFNGRSSEGITASLKMGTEAASEDAEGYLYFVADQPFMGPATLAAFAEGFCRSGRGMGCVCADGRTGNPSAFRSVYKEELLKLQGDKGGKQIMRAHPNDVWKMEVPGRELKDIDTPEDFKSFQKGMG